MFTTLHSKLELQAFWNEEKKIILDFYADWCPPCRKLQTVLERVSEIPRFREYVFLKVNVDMFPDLAGDHSILSIPTLVSMYKLKSESKKLSGFNDEETVTKFVDECFA